jgi:hypothetical protein
VQSGAVAGTADARETAARLFENATEEVKWQYEAARADNERKQRAKFSALSPDERRKEGPRQAQLKRHAPQREMHRKWKKRAAELWRDDGTLSISAVARTVENEIGSGALSTIRRVIAPLKPAQ